MGSSRILRDNGKVTFKARLFRRLLIHGGMEVVVESFEVAFAQNNSFWSNHEHLYTIIYRVICSLRYLGKGVPTPEHPLTSVPGSDSQCAHSSLRRIRIRIGFVSCALSEVKRIRSESAVRLRFVELFVEFYMKVRR